MHGDLPRPPITPVKGAITELEKDKEMPLCGFCTSYGELKMAGVKSEDITTEPSGLQSSPKPNPVLVGRTNRYCRSGVAVAP
jgi:hypothetical protein